MLITSLLVVVLSSSPSSPATLELEAQGGASFFELGGPRFGARAGVDLWRFFDPGIRFDAVVGSRPSRYQDGARYWTALPELRLHLPFDIVQPYASLGAGLGRVVAAGSVAENAAFEGPTGFVWQAGVGLRVLFGAVAVGLEGDFTSFAKVTSTPYSDGGPSSTGNLQTLSLALTVGGRFNL